MLGSPDKSVAVATKEATMDTNGISPLAERGKRIYEERLKALLEPAHKGEFVAIEPESGDYFLGRDMGEAGTRARAAHPERFSYLMRVGFPYAVEFSQRTR